jgi:SAM-dependent methyltransferase
MSMPQSNASQPDARQPDARQFAPATERNRDPILAVLQQILPATGAILEIASGTGEHAAFFAPQLSPRYWLPSDASPEALDSIRTWQEYGSCETLLSPVMLEVSQSHWPVEVQALLLQPPLHQSSGLNAIVNINMIHISPWSATLGLMAGAGQLLPPNGILYLYGPYRQRGIPTAPSNEAFDEMLRTRDPAWGIRNLEDVIAVASQHGLQFQESMPMPANNLSVIFKRVP